MYGLGCRVQGIVRRVWDLGLRVWGLGVGLHYHSTGVQSGGCVPATSVER